MAVDEWRRRRGVRVVLTNMCVYSPSVAKGAGETATQRESSAPWVSPDGAMLSVLAGDARGATVRLPGRPGGVVRVGKASDNDLVLPDRTVSRLHFTITRTDAGLVIRDEGSRNGLRVGGSRVKEAYVEPGMYIAAGDAILVVRVDGENAIVPPSNEERFGLAWGRSIAMRRIFGVLERMAPTDATILLTGETGTGKDVLARSIHHASPRSRGPFEVLDCGAVSESLIESELFGHERGAFTGAIAAHEGVFERAHGGTVFLDELGELPVALQPKLLRVLENRELRRVGGKKNLAVDVRIIAATTRDLPREVEAGRFRQDLFFRLAVVPVRVPPLRERNEDVALLAESLLANMGGGIRLVPETLAQLRSYPWPGNVRELRNVLERAVYLARASGDTEIRGVDIELPRDRPSSDGEDATAGLFHFDAGTTYREARARVEAEFERQFVAWALSRTNGNVAAAAREVKMDRKYLADLARKHGLV